MAHVKNIDKLRFIDIINDFSLYHGIHEGLMILDCPFTLRIRRKDYFVPRTFEEFCNHLCYGQRLFFSRKEENDFGLISRVIKGFYYPLVTKNKWSEDNALLFEKEVLTCRAKDIYPVAMQLISFANELADREQKLLHREPSKMELAAGIEKLNVFSELTSLDFLRDAMKCTVPEVLLTPYNECLVRFMIAKETADYQERYFELLKDESKHK